MTSGYLLKTFGHILSEPTVHKMKDFLDCLVQRYVSIRHYQDITGK